jgi:23S rRNA (uracil1939-C5)-methyltransferase
VTGEVLTIERVVAGGAGLARLADGKVAFVDGALPGETVDVGLEEDRHDFARARLLDVLQPSPHRVQPPCPHLAAGCGGCPWQHVAPGAQLDLKVDIVRDALRRTAGLPDAPVVQGGAVEPWGYRTGLRLAVATDGRLGLRRPASHDVVALDDCPVAAAPLSDLLGAIRADGRGEVALRVSLATGEQTVLPLAARHARAPRLTRTPPSVAVGRRAHLGERVAGADLRVSAPAFFQSGPQAAELLVAEVRAATADQRGPMLDAYGGVGLFAATAGSPDHEVVVVESSPAASADARVNLAGRHATVVESTVEAWRPAQPFDVAVADPARAGLGRAGVAAIVAAAARRILLVSCDPVAGARDVRLLAEHGYRLHRATVLDLFPHTAHVEVVSVLERD